MSQHQIRVAILVEEFCDTKFQSPTSGEECHDINFRVATPKVISVLKVTTSGMRIATLAEGIKTKGVESRHENLTPNYRVATSIPELQHQNEATTLKTKLQSRKIKTQSRDIETQSRDIVRTSKSRVTTLKLKVTTLYGQAKSIVTTPKIEPRHHISNVVTSGVTSADF